MIDQSFLLIVRTNQIVTALIKNSTVGYSEFPAFGRILLRQRIHLRTVRQVNSFRCGFNFLLNPSMSP